MGNQDKKYLTKRNVYYPILEPDCQMHHSKICEKKKTWHKMYSQILTILTENDQPETLVQAIDQVLSLFLTNNDRQTFPPFFKDKRDTDILDFLVYELHFFVVLFFLRVVQFFSLVMVNLIPHFVCYRSN